MGAAGRERGMTILGMIVTVIISFVVIYISYYVGRLVGYYKGVKAMLMSWEGVDVTKIIKDELKEMAGGKSSKS